MDFLDRNINFNALLKFSHISHSTQQHLKRVYSSFAICMLVAAAGAYVNVVLQLLQGSFLSFAGSLGMMIWLMCTPHSQETEKKRLGILAGFAFFSGVGLGPVLNLCISINPSALYAQRRRFLFLGGILLSALSLLLLSSLVNIFIGSVLLFKCTCTSVCWYIGLLVHRSAGQVWIRLI
uniref:Uncharacterized protein n=1 Tax=Leptobrachium leishanense TaxID=445787 RepID=A0A8C5QHY1_9ANUR